MTAWVCLWLGEPAGVQEMVIVRAVAADVAAQEGADRIEQELRAGGTEVDIEKIQVFPLPDRGEWFDISWVAAASLTAPEFQCCGGGGAGDGHSGYCPTKVGRDDG